PPRRSTLFPYTTLFRSRFNERRLSVETDLAPARAFADGDRLTQAFRNLLENSLRYTDAGGRVRIVARRDAGKIRIVVEDSDPARSEEHTSELQSPCNLV